MLICPSNKPCATKADVARMSTQSGWVAMQLTLDNLKHGGPIETHHEAIVLVPSKVAHEWTYPRFTEEPESMEPYLDPADGWPSNRLKTEALGVQRNAQVEVD